MTFGELRTGDVIEIHYDNGDSGYPLVAHIIEIEKLNDGSIKITFDDVYSQYQLDADWFELVTPDEINTSKSENVNLKRKLFNYKSVRQLFKEKFPEYHI